MSTATYTLSERIKRVQESPTMVISARAAALKAAGEDVIGLGAGEPDFDTPDFIKDAAIKAIRDGRTKYTPVGGTPSLKQAVCVKFERDNGLNYQSNQVLVSSGGKQGCYNLIQVLINPGDECIIPAPYWVSYPDMVLLADGKPVIIDTDVSQHFKITPEQLEAAITPRTKLLFMNSPSNPTGVAYTRAELEALGEVLHRHPQVIVGTDDMYEQILWAKEPFCNLVMACPDLYDRVVILHGVSKAYAMTGWRIGYNVGPKAIIDQMAKIQSQSTSNPCSVSQAAAEAALLSDQSCIAPMLEAFQARHDFVYQRFNELNLVSVVAADGAFYSFPNFQQLISVHDDIKNDIELAEFLLQQAGVALVPGSAFGSEGCLRLSFATSMDNLQDAMARIKRALN